MRAWGGDVRLSRYLSSLPHTAWCYDFMDTEQILCDLLLKWANAYSTPPLNRAMPGRRTQQLRPQPCVKGRWSSAKAQILTDPPPFCLAGTSERGNRAAKAWTTGLGSASNFSPRGWPKWCTCVSRECQSSGSWRCLFARLSAPVRLGLVHL